MKPLFFLSLLSILLAFLAFPFKFISLFLPYFLNFFSLLSIYKSFVSLYFPFFLSLSLYSLISFISLYLSILSFIL
jgi:hypothetical protein